MKILSILNDNTSPTGLLGECVARRSGVLDEVTPHEGDALPSSHGGHDGLIVMGGAIDAFDDASNPHLQPVMALMRDFVAAGKPLTGVCLGAQLLARAFGAPVYRLGEFEVGFTENRMTPAARQDALLRGLPSSQWLMQWHQDTFDLPQGAVLLMTGSRCRNQAFRLGECAYGFQFHLETTRPIVRSWFRSRADWFAEHRPDFYPMLQRQFEAHMADQMAFTRTVGDRWLDLVETQKRRRASAVAAQ